MTFKGVDIASLQSNVDFTWLKQQGNDFVIHRCMVGNDYKDPNCEANLVKAADVGLKTAVYNFVYFLPTDGVHKNRAPEEQAQWHFDNTPANQVVLLDCESPAPQDWQRLGVSGSFINDWLCRYLECYEVLSGQYLPVYTYPFYAKAVVFDEEIGRHNLWLAWYNNEPPQIPDPWQSNQLILVQDSGGNKLSLPNGIKVDTDYCYDLSIFDTK